MLRRKESYWINKLQKLLQLKDNNNSNNPFKMIQKNKQADIHKR